MSAEERRMYAAVASLECQHCGAHGTQVSHSNQIRDGHGRSIKSAWWRVAALCPACHYEIDQGSKLSKVERREIWDEAHRRTIGELFARGLLVPVKG